MKRITTCSPIVGQFFDAMIVAASDRVAIATHQNLSAGNCFEPPFKFENNTSGRALLWDTALQFLCPGLFITSPDHLDVILLSRHEQNLYGRMAVLNKMTCAIHFSCKISVAFSARSFV